MRSVIDALACCGGNRFPGRARQCPGAASTSAWLCPDSTTPLRGGAAPAGRPDGLATRPLALGWLPLRLARRTLRAGSATLRTLGRRPLVLVAARGPLDLAS